MTPSPSLNPRPARAGVAQSTPESQGCRRQIHPRLPQSVAQGNHQVLREAWLRWRAACLGHLRDPDSWGFGGPLLPASRSETRKVLRGLLHESHRGRYASHSLRAGRTSLDWHCSPGTSQEQALEDAGVRAHRRRRKPREVRKGIVVQAYKFLRRARTPNPTLTRTCNSIRRPGLISLSPARAPSTACLRASQTALVT